MRASTKLKAAGLALIAVFATSAMIASAAQANPNPLYWTCEKYPCVITGEGVSHPEIGTVHKLTLSSGKSVTCATRSDATIPSPELNSVLTVTPTYKECTSHPGNLPTTVTMNGCDYQLHGGEVTAGNVHHFEGGTTTIVCPVGKKIEVHIYANAAKHIAKEHQCTITIGPQTISGNTFTNTTETPWDVDVATSVTGIAVEVHPEGLICGKTKQTATYTGSTTLKAYEDLGNHTNGEGETVYTEGNQIGLTVSDG